MPSGAMPACVHCGKPAVVALDYANIDLCGLCFTCLFERRVWKANREFKLFKRGDRVVVGVSGGKDSSAMLFVLSKMAGQIGFEILPVLVDEGIEGYRDKTLEKAREFAKKNRNVSVFGKKNSGKGSAVKIGLEKAKGTIIIVQDADLEYDPDDYASVIAPILDGTTEAVIGVRSTDRHSDWFIYYFGLLGNGAITLLTNVLYGNNAGEYEGCYKAFSTRLVRTIEVKTDDFDFDNELVCKLLKRGVRIVDVPIRYYPRNYAEGKKITWRHGFLILWTVLKYRFID